MDASQLLSRERLAGYDPARLERAVVLLVGAGAAGSNIALNLALSGVGELRVVDFDHVEASNLSRAPLFRRERLQGGRVRHKARELAQGFLTYGLAPNPIARFATAPIESLGLGAFREVDVVVSAVDSFRVRAWLSDAARRSGIPFVECGFSAPRGHVSVFPNRQPGEACWRCLMPNVSTGGASCTLYAREAVSEGLVPATQTVAATFGALAAEAALLALHGEYPLGGRMLDLDVRTGRGSTIEVAADPHCASHTVFGDVTDLDVGAIASAAALFNAVQAYVADPILHLPMPYLLRAPCALCGASVSIGKPVYAVREPPICRTCPKVAQLHGQGIVTQSTVTPDDELSARACRALGLAPGAVFVIEDSATHEARAFRLAGSIDDLFTTLTRAPTPTTALDDAANATP